MSPFCFLRRFSTFSFLCFLEVCAYILQTEMDENDTNMLLITSCVLLIAKALKKRKRKTRTVWSKEWLQRRNEGRGVLHMLNSELRIEDAASYKNFLRMTSNQFDHILGLISPLVEKQDTCMRECISSRNK
jgi:hypothetical protein